MHGIVHHAADGWRSRVEAKGNITFADPQPRDSRADALRRVKALVRGMIGKARLFDALVFTVKETPDGGFHVTWDEALRKAASVARRDEKRMREKATQS